jgi:hypothetical protein
MGNWIRPFEVRTPQTMDEGNAALALVDTKIDDSRRSLAKTDNMALMEEVVRSWESKRREIEYAIAKMQAGETAQSAKEESRVHFIHDRACTTLAAFDELIAAGVTLTPMAADLRDKCSKNLPPGYRDRWIAEVLPFILARLT